MGKLAQCEFKVAGRSIWRFVGLILKHHFVAIGRAALYVYLHLWYVGCHNRYICRVS